jgi:uncharacterized membrane protein YfcA
MSESLSLFALVWGLVGLLLGGFSKGALGLGLPLIAVPILALAMPVPIALAILTIPIFITNVWQSMQGGHLGTVWRRFWSTGVALMVGIGVGTQVLVRLESSTLYFLMGSVVLLQPLTRLLKPSFVIEPRHVWWTGPLFGGLSGLLGGMTGFYGVVLIVYLTMLRLPKDIFTATIALMFLLGGTAMGIFLAQASVLAGTVLLYSVLALIPTVIGIRVGMSVRSRISQAQFEKGVTVMMVLMALSLFAKGVWEGN